MARAKRGERRDKVAGLQHSISKLIRTIPHWPKGLEEARHANECPSSNIAHPLLQEGCRTIHTLSITPLPVSDISPLINKINAVA